MTRGPNPDERDLRYEDGELRLEGRSLRALSDELGTPFLLVSESRLRRNYESLRRGLASHAPAATLRYCAKTNHEAGVLEILRSCGSHVLVSHPAEAELALACGFAPDTIAYQRPVLLDEEVSRVLETGVRSFHAYREEDISLLDRAAERRQQTVRVSLRLRNASRAARLSPLNFLSRRLGFSEPEILKAAARLRDSRNVVPWAINFYCGTQQTSARSYRELLGKAARLTAELRSRFGLAVEEINLGGGVPSGSLRRIGLRSLVSRLRDRPRTQDTALALESFARQLSLLFREICGRLDPPVRLGLEPGRSIVGNAGFLVTRVRAVKGSWVFLDASRNFLAESPILFSRAILPVCEPGGRERRFYHLSGNTLNTRDVVDILRRLPPLSEGDALLWCDAGAYSISRATRYAGLSPAVYRLATDGSLAMIRRPEGYSDLAAPMEMSGNEPRAAQR